MIAANMAVNAAAAKAIAKSAAKKEESEQMLAVIRIKKAPMMSVKTEDALNSLGLYKKFYCSVWKSSPQVLGMLTRVQSLVTWGEIDAETLKLLREKREEKGKKFFRLSPPRKGFERKGIKVPFALGGAYGNRGKEINELIRRML